MKRNFEVKQPKYCTECGKEFVLVKLGFDTFTGKQNLKAVCGNEECINNCICTKCGEFLDRTKWLPQLCRKCFYNNTN